MLTRTIKICTVPNTNAVEDDPIKGGQVVEIRSNPTEEIGPKKNPREPNPVKLAITIPLFSRVQREDARRREVANIKPAPKPQNKSEIPIQTTD